MIVRIPMSRRRFVATAAASTALSALGGVAAPYLSRAADRPRVTHGVQSGDVSSDSAVIWARADRPARMLAEVATSDSFKTIARAVFVDALPETDLTANALIDGLPAGQDVFYRIRFQDLASPTIVGESVTGRFRTAPGDRRSVSFVWSGDTAGQGWGIDEARGGMRTYATMLRNRPDFFIHNGDTIYADGSIAAEQKMPDGQIWKNLVSEDKAKSAETLAEFRGNYKYNLIDKNVLAFNAEVPIFAQWDDHEVTNNWWPRAADARRARAQEIRRKQRLQAARAARSTNTCRCASPRPRPDVYRKISYGPLLDVFMLDMRSYRAQRRRMQDTATGGFPSSAHAPGLPRELMNSGHLEGDRRRHAARPHRRLRHRSQMGRRGRRRKGRPARGRELEIADLLSFIKHAGIRNTLWLTADVHYTAAHYYDPDKAVFQDFEPFWEFVSGPLHAGSFPQNKLDNTFGPQRVYVKAPDTPNRPPSEGLQFFGHVAIDGATEVMTVTLKDVDDRALWSKTSSRLG